MLRNPSLVPLSFTGDGGFVSSNIPNGCPNENHSIVYRPPFPAQMAENMWPPPCIVNPGENAYQRPHQQPTRPYHYPCNWTPMGKPHFPFHQLPGPRSMVNTNVHWQPVHYNPNGVQQRHCLPATMPMSKNHSMIYSVGGPPPPFRMQNSRNQELKYSQNQLPIAFDKMDCHNSLNKPVSAGVTTSFLNQNQNNLLQVNKQQLLDKNKSHLVNVSKITSQVIPSLNPVGTIGQPETKSWANVLQRLIDNRDTKQVIYMAQICGKRELYITAAKYLQTTDWQTSREIRELIVQFYKKAKATDLLTAFLATENSKGMFCGNSLHDEEYDADESDDDVGIDDLFGCRDDSEDENHQKFHRLQFEDKLVRVRTCPATNYFAETCQSN